MPTDHYDDQDIDELFLRLDTAEQEIRALKLVTSGLGLLGRPTDPSLKSERAQEPPLPPIDLKKIVPFRRQSNDRLAGSERTSKT